MREIKFRAWDKVNKNMVEWDGMYGLERGDDGVGVHIAIADQCYLFPEDCIILQYIGLKDKNGKEIYEGDVVELQNPKNQIQKMRMSGVVIFSFASFGVEIKRVDEWVGYNVEPPEMVWFLSSINMKLFEVIGNIYEAVE